MIYAAARRLREYFMLFTLAAREKENTDQAKQHSRES